MLALLLLVVGVSGTCYSGPPACQWDCQYASPQCCCECYSTLCGGGNCLAGNSSNAICSCQCPPEVVYQDKSGKRLVFNADTLKLPLAEQPHREVCILPGGHVVIPTGSCNLSPFGCSSLGCPQPCTPWCSCPAGYNFPNRDCRDLADSEVIALVHGRADLVFRFE